MPNGENPFISNDYADLIVDYIGTEEEMKQRYNTDYVHNVDSRYAVVYVPMEFAKSQDLIDVYGSHPKILGLMDLKSSSIRTTERPNLPTFNLDGKDTLVAVIDTGIDYTNTIFRKPDGTSKIAAIWDQTLEGNKPPDGFFYGTEYTQEEINLALMYSDPFSIVPSMDTIGHGTFLSGVIAGNNSEENDFYSVSPGAEMIVVKLKMAKSYLKEYFVIPQDSVCYQENDIVHGIQYALNTAQKLNKPVAICIALGTNETNYQLGGLLSNYLNYAGTINGRAFIIAAGNEGLSRHHYLGDLDREDFDSIQLHISEEEPGFMLQIWGDSPNEYYAEVESPSGELLERAKFNLIGRKVQTAQLGNTSVEIEYNAGGIKSISELIIIRFRTPDPGVWTIRVYSMGDFNQNYHAWLPINQFVSPDTYFLVPDPYTTITSPGNSPTPLTVSGCDLSEKIFYKYSSRGFTTSNSIKPDFAAPCEDIIGPTLDHGFTTLSGTSLAAAYVTGITANLFEWGAVNQNYPNMNNFEVKRLLIRGATRRPNMKYPDREWGYGVVNLLGTFNVINDNNAT